MSDFNAEMHKIRFRLRPRAPGTDHATALPRPLAGFEGPTSKKKGGKGTGASERKQQERI